MGEKNNFFNSSLSPPSRFPTLQLLKKIKELYSDTAVIMISAHGTFEVAVEAVKLGAENFLSKPFNSLEEVLFHVEKALEIQEIKKEPGRSLFLVLDFLYCPVDILHGEPFSVQRLLHPLIIVVPFIL